MKRYNGLNNLKIDLSKSGICAYCGRRFTDPLCTHATLEQIEATKAIDAEIDTDYDMQAVYGKFWEKDADKLHDVLVNGNEMIELAEQRNWLEPDTMSPSPTIEGGELIYRDGYKSSVDDDSIPF